MFIFGFSGWGKLKIISVTKQAYEPSVLQAFSVTLVCANKLRFIRFIREKRLSFLISRLPQVLNYIELLTSELFLALCFVRLMLQRTSTTICLPLRDQNLTCFCWKSSFALKKELASTIQETTDVKSLNFVKEPTPYNPFHVPIMWSTGKLCRYTTLVIQVHLVLKRDILN